ncbi:hypothetical protein EBZ37_05120 [bacterium]|nr:hypothetical protein [bacterium]
MFRKLRVIKGSLPMGFQKAQRSSATGFRVWTRSGLSLVEILVVSGIVSILTVIISSVLVNTSKQVRSVEATSDYNALVALFQSTFNNGDSCIKALNSMGASVAFQKPPATGLDINIPATLKIGGTEYKTGEKYQGVKISQLNFKRVEPVNEAKGQYKLNLLMEVDRSLGSTTAVGGNIKQETFELIVEAQPVSGSSNLAITACYGMFENLWSRKTGSNDIYVKGLRVGINSDSPQFELDVSGTVRGGAFIYNSDLRLKENVRDLDAPLDKVLALHGVKFDWKS